MPIIENIVKPIYHNKEYLQEQYNTLRKTADEIAQENNVCPHCIRSWLKKYNIKKEKPNYRNKLWLKSQYNDSEKSIKEIAKELHVNPCTISLYLDKFTIPKRTKSQAIKLVYKHKKEAINIKKIRIQYREYSRNNKLIEEFFDRNEYPRF